MIGESGIVFDKEALNDSRLPRPRAEPMSSCNPSRKSPNKKAGGLWEVFRLCFC